MIFLAAVSYPLAYRSRMRNVVEGSSRASTRSWIAAPIMVLLHKHAAPSSTATRNLSLHRPDALANAASPGLPRDVRGSWPRARHFMCTDAQAWPRQSWVRFLDRGLRAAVPIIAFWTVAGLRAAFLGPADRRVNWLFRIIHGKPGWDESAATRMWVLLWALALTLGSVALIHAVAPPALRDWKKLRHPAIRRRQPLPAADRCLFSQREDGPVHGHALGRVDESGLRPHPVLRALSAAGPDHLSLEDWMAVSTRQSGDRRRRCRCQLTLNC